jgi:uncharacterized protein (DUF1697 family)
METNLKTSRNLLLTCEDGNIAVISCIKGKAKQITAKIELAIKEHYNADSVFIVDSYTIDNLTEPQKFEVHIFNDGADFYDTFTLEFIEIY